MDIIDVIRARRAVGKSTGDVSRATIGELIEAAVWADAGVKAFLGLQSDDRIVAIVAD